MSIPTPLRRLKQWRPALSREEHRFVFLLMEDPRLDPEEVARRLGMPKGAGSKLVNLKHVRSAIEMALEGRQARVNVGPDYVLSRWAQVVRADPRELVELWRVPCRHCWGVDHLYQYDDVELRAERTNHIARQMKLPERDRVEFDDQGGGGYTLNRLPCRGPDYAEFTGGEANADHSCPRCSGHGQAHAHYHDTRELSEDALALYLGVKTTNSGVEMVMRSKPEAEQLLARHMGLLPDRKREEDPTELTDEQLDAELSRLGVVVDAEFTDVTPRADAASDVDGGEAEATDLIDAEPVE